MPFAKAACKAPVLEGMIEVLVRVVLPGVMPDPFVAAGMDVRSVGVALHVAVGTKLLRALFRLRRSGSRRWGWSGMRSRAARGNVSPANAADLSRRRNRKQHECEEYSEKVFHVNLLKVFWRRFEVMQRANPLRAGTKFDGQQRLSVAQFEGQARASVF